MDKERHIFLVRHFATSMNIGGRYMGRNFDPPIEIVELSDNDPKVLGLKRYIITGDVAFFSSPTLRCKQTLDLFKGKLGLSEIETHYERDLQETDFGEASGLTVKEIREKYPEVYRAWIEDQSKVKFPGGESYQDVQETAWNGLKRVYEETDKSTIIICTHVDVIKMILFRTVNIPISAKPLFVINNGSICSLIISRGKVKISGISRFG